MIKQPINSAIIINTPQHTQYARTHKLLELTTFVKLIFKLLYFRNCKSHISIGVCKHQTGVQIIQLPLL